MQVGVALSGGGAKGSAHIGVLRALEETGVTISYVSGTSSGSIMAALYAAGYTVDEMEEAVSQFVKKKENKPTECATAGSGSACCHSVNTANARKIIDVDYLGALYFLFQSIFFKFNTYKGFVKGDLLRKAISELLAAKGVHMMRDFKKPIVIPAMDIKSMETVYFSNRTYHSNVITNIPAAEAVTASCAFPGVFRPREVGKYLLVDGGVLDNLPIEALRLIGATYTVGVQLSDVMDYTKKKPVNFLDIVDRSLNAIRYKYENLTDWMVDYMINPEIKNVSLLDLSELCRCIELGYEAAKKRLKSVPMVKVLAKRIN